MTSHHLSLTAGDTEDPSLCSAAGTSWTSPKPPLPARRRGVLCAAPAPHADHCAAPMRTLAAHGHLTHEPAGTWEHRAPGHRRYTFTASRVRLARQLTRLDEWTALYRHANSTLSSPTDGYDADRR